MRVDAHNMLNYYHANLSTGYIFGSTIPNTHRPLDQLWYSMKGSNVSCVGIEIPKMPIQCHLQTMFVDQNKQLQTSFNL